jgi:PPOX class probable F420-dependent enzyme
LLIDDPGQNARVEERLRREPVVWLTTVRRDGQPQSTPVWFLWDGALSLLIYSQDHRQKLRNIAGNPKVALHFNDHDGSDVVSLEGEAVTPDERPLHEVEAYVEKYRELIRDLGSEPEPFSKSYSVPIRVRITGARAPF